ncbi:unnamed protein product [Calicophoron daubneyi]|uniref:cysteine--tRNA ligase n=1 Tax=Calicophoron daubneyi TaxID=300641 RepID=A0AAV2TST0_CALDB
MFVEHKCPKKTGMEKRTQPPWKAPSGERSGVLPKLTFYNSLSSKKELFIPEQGNKVKWYTCGPTVYDISHMGHARTYIAFDIVRRILEDFFQFDVVYVLNITDIDDKIIKRARQNYLMDSYVLQDLSLPRVYTDIAKAIRKLKDKSAIDPDPDKRDYLRKESERLTSLLGSDLPKGEEAVSYLVNQARDAIADVLDQERGASVTDPKVFESLARKYEEEYIKDMRALNIMDADLLVRVTEYINPIIKFVEKIIENGFAYAAPSGSVYFDTNRFASDPRHFYAKLVPTAFGDTEKLAVGEGELASEAEKRSPNDFALWKASKRGEPSWPSPWGPGRPGWHIECSVMASSVFGGSMDIHGGGVDLKFPHHDNELAQSEAYFGHSHWVRYFLHAGHLTIAGCKMSKSLKNFITIRDALKQYSSRRIRLTFLLHSWRETMDYSPDTLNEAISYEKGVIDFLYNASSLHLMAVENSSQSPPRALPAEKSLMPQLMRVQLEIYNALCDSCDTRRALTILKDFITLSDQYALNQVCPGVSLLQLSNEVYIAACFVLRLLRVFGVADLTNASSGTPAPAHEVVAGGFPSAELRPIKLGDEMIEIRDPSELLCRSWLSLDALTVDRLATVLHLSLKSLGNFTTALTREGGTFAEIARNGAESISHDYGLDLSNLPVSARDCLESVVKTATNKTLSTLVESEFGIETNAWPVVYRLLYRLASLRQIVRALVLSDSVTDRQLKSRLMEACDRMRDVDLVTAGVRLQDRTGVQGVSAAFLQTPYLGIVDPTILAEEVMQKNKREAERREAKAHQAALKQEQGRQSPSEMFRHQTDKYSQFDAKGMPTHDAEGQPIPKSQLKKLQKLYDAQAKRHATFLRTKQLVNGDQ